MSIPYIDLYEKIILIRKFENRLLELFSEGKLFGTTHTYVGQEAIAVSVIDNLHKDDIVFSNHRCHGHYLAKEDDPKGLLGEIMGRDVGTCAGRGGSQHLCRGNFFSNGIQGGYLPNALGMAFAEKYTQTGNIVVAFIGDGTFGEGAVYETMNLASLWKVPLLIVVENNRYAQTTSIDENLAGSILERSNAFGISSGEVESNDIRLLHPIFKELINHMRKEGGPHLQVVNTYRFNAHSKGDDFRAKKEIDFWRKKDPLSYFKNILTKSEREGVEYKVNQRLSSIEQEVVNASFAHKKS
jgi:TPP-dependent pyruvate/acetoin dehydrogenase alpha subunit